MLLDSNIIIYSMQHEYPQVRDFIAKFVPIVSIASYVEVLGFQRINERDVQGYEDFFSAAVVLPISFEVARNAVHLRQQRKMSLGDAMIAGTALTYDLTLVTHNTEDFRRIEGLNLVDPVD